MTVVEHPGPQTRDAGPGPGYKWIALSNTTLGMLMATINSSIVLIALPDIFRGIGINPLEPGNTSYLLWMIMGFLVVTAVLVVGFGRLGDMFGRVRMYNLGFAVFTVASVLLWLTWQQGDAAALWLIGWRIVQGIGGAFLMANSSAILTDAFPQEQRGLALGINGVAAIAGSFLGLVIGGLLGPVDWKLVFLVSVPFGLFGTVWAYLKLRDTGERRPAKMDWWGNVTFAVGLIAILVGITYGIQPYGDSVMGWGSPTVLTCLIGGAIVLVAFCLIERRVANPLFTLSLFGNRRFTLGNIANLLGSLGRGGLQFMLIIWLQGIWLPQHGYSFEQTPLWAGIYMLPLTVGFLIAAPISGVLCDRFGARWFSTGGLLLSAVSFLLMMYLPINFNYVGFAVILLVNGLGMGLFSSPNRADIMNSLPASSRGAGSGMTATFQNAAMVLSIGFFFSLMIGGLSQHLPAVMEAGLTQHGVPAAEASQIAGLPPVAVLFAAFLGYNPIQQLLGPVLGSLPPDQAAFLTGRSFFPQLITGPFADGITAAFTFAVIACVVAAVASWFAGGRVRRAEHESVGGELAAVAGEAGGPSELVTDDFETDRPRFARAGELIGHLSTGGGPDGIVTVTDRDGHQIARTTAHDGEYAVTGLAPGTYTAVATAPGFRPAVAAVTLNGVGVVRDFSLDGNGVAAGSVTGPDGRGRAGALVIATDAAGTVVGRAHTATDGSFRMAGLPVGPTTLAASVPPGDGGRHQPAGWVDAEPDAVTVEVDHTGTATADLVLTWSQGGVAGVVTGPDARPLGRATVVVTGADGTVAGRATADDDGRYALAGLRSGTYTVVASLLTPASTEVRVPAGEPVRVDLRLEDPAGSRAEV